MAKCLSDGGCENDAMAGGVYCIEHDPPILDAAGRPVEPPVGDARVSSPAPEAPRRVPAKLWFDSVTPGGRQVRLKSHMAPGHEIEVWERDEHGAYNAVDIFTGPGAYAIRRLMEKDYADD